MVLPVWIEHTTSPLPRGCSTTELRRRAAAAATMPQGEKGGKRWLPLAPLAGLWQGRAPKFMAMGLP